MYDIELWRRAACSNKDKIKIVRVIEMLVRFAEKARAEGLLSLEDELQNIDSTFIKNGIRRVVDGYDPQIVREMLMTRIYAGHYAGMDLLTRMVAAKGILSIQQGLLPTLVREEMFSCLGEGLEPDYDVEYSAMVPSTAAVMVDMKEETRLRNEVSSDRDESVSAEDEACRSKLMDILSAHKRIVSDNPVTEQEIKKLVEEIQSSELGIRAFISVLRAQPAELSSLMIEGIENYAPELCGKIMKKWFVFEDLANCDDRVIQKVLFETDTQDLAKAMKGAIPELQKKIFSNMSKRAVELLREDIKYMGPIRYADAEDAQNKIIRIVQKLEESGDIIIARPGERFV
jgi:hypothetical protein